MGATDLAAEGATTEVVGPAVPTPELEVSEFRDRILEDTPGEAQEPVSRVKLFNVYPEGLYFSN